MSREQLLVDAARSMLDTPFHHQGRLPGVGLDCIGLLACSAKIAGALFEDQTDYHRQPNGLKLQEEFDRQADRIELKDVKPGNILLFRMASRLPQHAALATDIGIIHTFQYIGKVVEHRFDAHWNKRVTQAYALRWPH